MSCIVTNSLSKSYDNVTAVDGIDLDVKSGQVFGFLGTFSNFIIIEMFVLIVLAVGLFSIATRLLTRLDF